MISVVIPTRSRADLLAPALESITRQTLPITEFEVLVIDNGSTDATTEIISEYQKKLTNLSSIYAPEPGLHTGRHAGMLASKGEVLIFADDDIEALPTWLETIRAGFKNSDVAMMGGNNLPMFIGDTPGWLDRLWKRKDHAGGRSLPWLSISDWPEGRYPISPYQIWGCNFAIRKSILLAAGGFHPDGMPEELIRFRGDGETHVSRYVEKNILKCLFDSGASVYHKVTPARMTFEYFHQRGFNQGVSDSYTQLRGDADTSSDRSLTYRLARRAWRMLRRLFQPNRLDKEARFAIDEFHRGHKEGFAYHQAMYRNDPEVRTWVHLEKYY